MRVRTRSDIERISFRHGAVPGLGVAGFFSDGKTAGHYRRGGRLVEKKAAFTFLEVLVALVILSVGITGIYRAFFIALTYQQHILTRLHVINFLSDEFARAENILIQKTSFSSAAGEVRLPYGQSSQFLVKRVNVPLGEEYQGGSRLQIGLLWSQGERSREFLRESFVYVPD